MISIVIPYYEAGEWKRPILKGCVKSFSKFDAEIIVMSGTESSLPATINHGIDLSSGDFVIVTNDDVNWKDGSIEKLCIDDTVTSPCINSQRRDFSGHIWAAPRTVFEKVINHNEEKLGKRWVFDENFENAYYDDDDFLFTVRELGIGYKNVPECNVYHPPHGGTTLHEIDNMPAWRERNKQYFEKKWGRLP